MTDAQELPLSSETPSDADGDPDDLVEGADDLPDDVPNADLGVGEPPDLGDEDDTDVDAPVDGSPDDDVIHDEDDELDGPDA